MRELIVFIASPSDVPEERDAVRQAVDALNSYLGKRFSVRLRAAGWEHVQPSFGRPQELINPLVDECDIFIGILSQRWGSPTGTHDSGFHEEFERVVARLGISSPNKIGVFFKRMSAETLADPGPKARTVLEFKKKVIEEHTLLFMEFTDGADFRAKIRDFLFSAILEEISATSGAAELEPRSNANSNVEKSDDVSASDPARSQLAEILAAFQNLIRSGAISPNLDSDRLLLFSLAISRDDSLAPTHTINRMYLQDERIELTESERLLILKTILADIGRTIRRMDHLRAVPGWKLLLTGEQTRVHLDPQDAFETLKAGNTTATLGCLYVMQRTGLRPSALWGEQNSDSSSLSGANLERRPVVDRDIWNSILSNRSHREAALEYIYSVGSVADLPLLRSLSVEIQDDDARKICLAVCNAVEREFNLLAEIAGTEYGDIPHWIRRIIISNIESIEHVNVSRLVSGRHKSNDVRRAAFKVCIERGEVDREALLAAIKSEDRDLQKQAVRHIGTDRNSGALSKELAETIKKMGKKNKELEFRSIVLAITSTKEELRDAMRTGLGVVDAWSALCLKRSTDLADEAREVLDSNAGFLDSAIGEIAKDTEYRQLVDFMRSRARLAAIEIIGDLSKDQTLPSDLPRLRKELAIQDMWTISPAAIALSRLGEREDAERLFFASRETMVFDERMSLIEAAVNLGGETLARRVLNSNDSRADEIVLSLKWLAGHGAISTKVLMEHLSSKEDEVRACAARLLFETLPRTHAEEVVRDYPRSADYYYYNVPATLDQLLYGPDFPQELDS